MKYRAFTAKALVFSVFCMFLFPMNAHAYLDPGTGSYVLQLALAALVGTLFAIRLFWNRIKSFFGNLLSKQEGDEQNDRE
jgi:hypothetical protein